MQFNWYTPYCFLTWFKLTSPHAEEIILVQKAQKNINDFGVLYQCYFEKIYKFFHFRLGSQPEAEDLTSETFEKAVKNLHTYEYQGHPFSTWLFRIAHNVLIDHFRASGRKKNTSLENLTPHNEPRTEFNLEEIDNKELIEKVRKEVLKLPKLQQDIWALKLNADMSNQEIAETLGLSANYVNVSLFRSLKVIKNNLTRYRSWKYG